jgi:type I restriction enzyme S subunit
MQSLRIKEVFNSIRNGANIKQDKSSGGIPITRIETISENQIDLTRLGYAGIDNDAYSDYYLQEGDILMSHINSISHLGKVGIFENIQQTVIHGMNLLCLKADAKLLYPKYAYYYFRTSNFTNSLKPITKKSVNQASFNISDFELLKIPVPTLSDQIKIATVLSKAEVLIKLRRENIELLDEFLKNRFLKMFREYFQKVNSQKLETLCTKITDGTHDTPERLKQGVKFITGKHIRPYVIDFDNSDYVTKEVHQEIYRRCNPEFGDVLYTNIGVNLGTAAMNTVNFEFSMKNVALLKLNQMLITSRYLEHFLNLPSRRNRILELNSSGGAQQFLSLGQIKNIDVPVPPIDLQESFSEIVEKTEIIKSQLKSSLVVLENLYGSLSQRAFKGELDLSAVKIDESLLSIETQQVAEQPESLPQEIWNALEVAAKISKQFEKVSDLAKTATKFTKHFETWDKINRSLTNIPQLPSTLLQAQENMLRIQKAFSAVITVTKPQEKITWDRVSSEQFANWIKGSFTGFHFTSEMLISFLTEEHVTFPDYYSSEELKKNPKANDADDFKSFIFAALNNRNPFLRLEQVFYNGEMDSINLTLRPEDFELIKDKSKAERTGVYLQIVE